MLAGSEALLRPPRVAKRSYDVSGTQAHLQLLADVATRFDDPAIRAALRNASDADAMRAVFEQAGEA